MRNPKFILSAAAILLAGAITAGLAAQSVVTPRTGEVQSAGPAAIPTVLGQTAEEVLFPPWSMYESQTLRHFTEDELFYGFELFGLGETLEEVYALLPDLRQEDLTENGPFLLFNVFNFIQPVDIPWIELFSSLEYNDRTNRPATGSQLFLKDLPATAYLGEEKKETPVTLSFALGDSPGTSLSFLIRPAQAREIGQNKQAAALAKVEEDLRELLLNNDPITMVYYKGEVYYEVGSDGPSSEMHRLLQTFYTYYLNSKEPPHLSQLFGSIGHFLQERRGLREWFAERLDDPNTAPMDDFLSVVELSGVCTVQIITTQQQIVVLFTTGSGVFGVYYDIQLDCYSGIGIME